MANPQLVTKNNFYSLIDHAAYADKIGKALYQLNSRALDTPENIRILIRCREFIDKFLVEIQSQYDFNQK